MNFKNNMLNIIYRGRGGLYTSQQKSDTCDFCVIEDDLRPPLFKETDKMGALCCLMVMFDVESAFY